MGNYLRNIDLFDERGIKYNFVSIGDIMKKIVRHSCLDVELQFTSRTPFPNRTTF